MGILVFVIAVTYLLNSVVSWLYEYLDIDWTVFMYVAYMILSVLTIYGGVEVFLRR